MIAYSLLQKLDPKRYRIPLLVTIGSPLGLAEVKSQIRRINHIPKSAKMPTPACVDAWLNVLDLRDLIAHKQELHNHYQGACTPVDVQVKNPEPGDPHSATGYLQLPTVRSKVREVVDIQRFQEVAPFRLSSDAIRDFESAEGADRRPLLIELTDADWGKRRFDELDDADAGRAYPDMASLLDSPDKMADAVVDLIDKVLDPTVQRYTKDKKQETLRIQRLRRYVSVHLTRAEAERLSTQDPALAPFYRVWRNAKKRALLDQSIHTVQVSAAHRSYEALGEGIRWAVLDSGCAYNHPHFQDNGINEKVIAERWDCTLDSDRPVQDGTKLKNGKVVRTHDGFGHGTHVAGIIGGRWERKDGRLISGMAPRAKLHVYKVLNDEGLGDDAWIIKALDHIATVNEGAGVPVIAGVNLSLGGSFDQEVFGCGHTPLCDELRRLWHQGVVVVISAGNEGFATLLSTGGEIPANMPLSIGDPANLEEAIAVGAVHQGKPHTYGISHFSSRGPTADGRNKPDCVAPGEQILSCRNDFVPNSTKIAELYVKMDGTSMAAPHVSGIIAAFLSRRREFVGYPDRVKSILLENCTDLGRDRAMQGFGMPNLVKMLVAT